MTHRRSGFTLALLAGALLAVVARGATGTAVAQSDLLAYTMVDQWPERQAATTGLFQSPADLDVAADGRMFIADPGVGGVHTLLPSGTFAAPFGVTGGFPAQLGRVGAVSVGPDPAADDGITAERVYVLDPATERVVIYNLDGVYVGDWEKIDAASIAASSDGRVYVLDRETSQVRALDAATGAQRFAFGERGTERGQFANFTDVAVSDDGRVLAVGDLSGVRVQLFDLADDAALAGPNPPAPATARREYDLLAARYNKGDNTCRAGRVNALGGDKVFVGEGTTACLVDGTAVTVAIAVSANNGTICRATVRLPTLKAAATQYFAVATYDPNSGNCDQKRTDLPTSRVVVRYDDEELRGVRTVWQVVANDEARDPALFAPQRLSMPAPDVMFVEDRSSKLRFYSLDGTSLGTVARDSSMTDAGTDTQFFRLMGADGSETVGEVYGGYARMRRSGTSFEFESGIGRFKNVVKQGKTGPVDVIEPVWTSTFGSSGTSGRRSMAFPTIAYNATSGELLVLVSETVEQARTTDMKIVRFTADGQRLAEVWDLPDDGTLNPYADMAVGPDGRIYALDDIADVVRILAPDGQPAGEVPVIYDARAVAGGPASAAGSVFVMREAGAIERYADDGTITARLDGRPLAFSDPTTLTDLVVDGRGRVYVADGQSSLISVFEPSGDPDAIPVPADGTCLFQARKSAAPSSLRLGESVTVTLGVEGLCAAKEDPSDIVVVVPYYGELQQGRDPAMMMITQLTMLGARLDYTNHRLGIVSYYQTTNVDLELTHDQAAFDQAVRDVKRYTAPNDTVKPRLRSAMQAAGRLYDAGHARRKVMLLLNPLYCDPANETTAGQCAGYVSADDVAAQLRAEGVTIIVLGGFGGGMAGPRTGDGPPVRPGGPGGPPGDPGGERGPGTGLGGTSAANLASSDEDVLRDVMEAHGRMVNVHMPDTMIQVLGITDEVPADMAVDPASISAGGAWSAPRVTWQAAAVDFDGLDLSFRLTPRLPGRQATNVSALAELVDGWGAQHTLTFPVPEIDVIGPTATPAPPTATPSPTAPPTATAVPPTPTAQVHSLYLPRLERRYCTPGKAPLDLVVVLDASNSMTGERLAAAVAAVGDFLDALDLGRAGNHVALVSFAIEARVMTGLTGDRAALAAGLDGVVPSAGTRIDRGLTTALQVLDGPAAQPRAVQAILLLSDGGQTQEPDAARAVAREARARAVEVYAVDVGDGADSSLLSELATDPDAYHLGAVRAHLQAVLDRVEAGRAWCP